MQRILKFWSRPHIWSNLVYLFPIGIALFRGYTVGWMLLSITLIFSVIYHSFDNEVNIEWFFLRKGVLKAEFLAGIIDYLCSILVVIIFTSRFIHSDPSLLATIIFVLLVMLGVIVFLGPTYSLFLRRWPTTISHSAWHIISGSIATVIVLVS